MGSPTWGHACGCRRRRVEHGAARRLAWRTAAPLGARRPAAGRRRRSAQADPGREARADRRVVARFADLARAEGVERLEVLITSPGRQAANGEILATTLAAAARVPGAHPDARPKKAGWRSQARSRWRRRRPGASSPWSTSAGGSAQIVVGSRRTGPRFTQSIDLGSQRLTSRLLGEDPPGAEAVLLARAEVDRYVEPLEPPPIQAAFAVGGSARALKRLNAGATRPRRARARDRRAHRNARRARWRSPSGSTRNEHAHCSPARSS